MLASNIIIRQKEIAQVQGICSISIIYMLFRIIRISMI